MKLKTLLAEVSFYEAHFRSHYIRTTPVSYPIPLPTSVAGIFGAMLGWERNQLPEEIYTGAKILEPGKTFTEAYTYYHFDLPSDVRKGVASMELISNPCYLIAMASGDDVKIIEWSKRLEKEEYVFLPYGGQNDFFVKDIRFKGVFETTTSREIEGYAPSSMVEKIEKTGPAPAIISLHVSYRKKHGELFLFVLKDAKLILKNEVLSINGIPLYNPKKDFYTPGR